MSALVQEWRQFRNDTPGERFEHHHDRMQKTGSRAGAVARLLAGIVLVTTGIVMLFIPGPGLIALLFGFGLLGGQSKMMARGLDRVEPVMRHTTKQAVRTFEDLSPPTRIALVAVAALLAAGAVYLAWRWLS